MEAGLPLNYRLGFIIQARMSSERLPGKVLLPLPFPTGESILSVIISQVKKISNEIYLATSTNSENDPLIDLCIREGISNYRGSEQNVLNRFVQLQEKYNFEHIIRLTADNPLIDTDILIKAISFHINNDYDYTSTIGLPVGMNFEIFKGSSLLDSSRLAVSDVDFEHVTTVLRKAFKYSRGIFKHYEDLSHIRLTIDTSTDYLLLNSIFSLKQYSNLEGIDLIHFIQNTYPWLWDLNKNIIQKNTAIVPFETEVYNAVTLLEKYDYKASAKLLLDSFLST